MAATYPSDWIRAVLAPAILACVAARGQSYGYLVAKDLAAGGLGEVAGGTLYPVLRRLEGEELIVSSWREGDSGPSRKYYELTALGRAHLEQVRRDWGGFVAAVNDTLWGGTE